jgi:hypothetical protein
MRQYEFEISNRRTKRIEHARATARTAAIARAQIVLMYGAQFDVMTLCSDVNPPHHILGEIDCSEFDETQSAWLFNEANNLERSYK